MSSFNLMPTSAVINPSSQMTSGSDPESATLNKCLELFKYAQNFRTHFEPRWRRNIEAYFNWDAEIKAKNPRLNRVVVPRPFLIVETKLPRVMKQLFTKENLYTVLPGSKDDIEKAKLWSEALSYQVRTHDNILQEYTCWIKDAFIMGTGVAKTGWKLTRELMTRREKQEIGLDLYTGQPVVKNNMTRQWVTTEDKPYVKALDVGEFYPDPGADNIESCKYIIHRYLVTRNDLKIGQANGIYKNTDRISGGSFIAGSVSDFLNKRYSSQGLGSVPYTQSDPIYDLVEILECWYMDEYGCKRKTMIANQHVVIQDIPAPYWHNRFPFYILKNIPITGEFWGWGEIDPVYDLWKELSQLRTLQSDNRDKFCGGFWMVDRTKNINLDELANMPSGGILEVTGDPQSAIYVHRPDMMKETTIAAEQQIDSDIQMTSGVNDIAIGTPTRSQVRTATTGSLLAQSTDTRFGLTSLLFVEQIKKVGRDWLAMDQQFLSQAITVRIANDHGVFGYEQASPTDIPREYDIFVASGAELAGDKDVIRQQKLQLFSVLSSIPGFRAVDYAKELLADFNEKAPERFFEGSYVVPDQQIQSQLGGTPSDGNPVQSKYLEMLGGLTGGGTQAVSQADLLEGIPYGQ